MRAVISVLCFIVVVFLVPSESMFGFNRIQQEMPDAMLVMPPKLSAYCYYAGNPEGDPAVKSIGRGFVHVETMKEGGVEYVIGYVENVKIKDSILHPFVHISPDFALGAARIKIRVDGNYAYKYIPIPGRDPLNDVFFKPYNPELIRVFDIDFEHLRKPLEPAFPVQATNFTARGRQKS